MLSKEKRLNLSKNFKWVSSGKSVYTSRFRLFVKHGSNTFAKIGIAITSKQFPKATMRNKAKRIMSRAFEKIYPGLPESINIIALPKPGIDKVKSEDLAGELSLALKELL